MDCDVNRALGYDPCHGCIMVMVLFSCVVYFSDIGSDVIDRIRIDLVLLYFKFIIVILRVQDQDQDKWRTGTMKIEIAGQVGAFKN